MPYRKCTKYQIINMYEYVGPKFDPFINGVVWKMSTCCIIETIETSHGGYPFFLEGFNSSSSWVLMKYGQEVAWYILYKTVCSKLWLKCPIFIDGIRILGGHKILVNFADECEWFLQRGKGSDPCGRPLHKYNESKSFPMMCKISIFLEFTSCTASSRLI